MRAPSIMAHCVHLMPGEEEIFKQTGASIAHCPLSNFFFAKEALPVKQLLKRGLKIGLGTDIAGGYSPSMFNAMRTAVLASKTLQFRRPPGCGFQTSPARQLEGADEEEIQLREEHDLTHFQALYLSTQGGAIALGLDSHLGTFDQGKAFDALIVAPDPTVMRFAGGTAESPEDVLQKIITLGDDRNVRQTFVGGKLVHQVSDAMKAAKTMKATSATKAMKTVKSKMLKRPARK
eukprot:gnl/MRDRNA2_/MRDRNA2_143229_c0_seq1.p1 gnl/MRDRNA2_/MRDRNA2_143229_c0~~gnl/MRDRNA2_/MRDRNA2_143229_c0_seq1.p1  ORF type:complete len:253 (-),score=58.83 gnl/MRDRNA2_/MRDRNA2_143229_c0_seq1:181-882(-)